MLKLMRRPNEVARKYRLSMITALVRCPTVSCSSIAILNQAQNYGPRTTDYGRILAGSRRRRRGFFLQPLDLRFNYPISSCRLDRQLQTVVLDALAAF